MIESIKQKIRALVGDWEQNGFEIFTYRNSGVFKLAEDNVNSIIEVMVNGEVLGTGEYSFDTSTNKITITITGLANGDIIQVEYKYYKYSDAELTEYIRGALVWISQASYQETDFELEDDDIYPTPDNRETDLIALIASILIKPDYTSYQLPNLRVNYDGRMPKDQKIQQLITRFKMGIGINGVIEFEDYGRLP